jgi:DNA-binding transcriptional MocR family regulator
MMRLGKLIGEKFEITLAALETLAPAGIASWTKPVGGYFISLSVMEGTAKRVFDLMASAGVVLTPAGATHPYGVDPKDSVLRLAPTYPSNEDLSLGCEILAVCVRLAALEKLLG